MAMLFRVCLLLLVMAFWVDAKNLPNGPLILAYANWDECDEKVVKLEKEVLTHELTAREEQVHRQPRSMAASF